MVRSFTLGSLAVAFVLGACAPTARLVTITSEPTGAFIQIDGENAGTTPISETFELRKARHVVTATKAGYFPQEKTVHRDSPELARGQITMALMEDEAWKVTTTSEATNSWLRIQVDGDIETESVWQKLVDSVTSAYSSLEQLDNSSGYMRSVSTIRKFKGPRGEFRVRTRFIGAIAQRQPLVYKLKIESEIAESSDEWQPYARVFKQDGALIEELQSRLGVK